MPSKKILVLFITIFILLAGCSTPQSQMPTATLDTPTPSPTISITPPPSPTLTPSPSSPPATPENAQTQAAIIMGTVSAISQLTETVLNQTATILALTPSKTPTITPTPTITLTPTQSPTPNPTSLAQATLVTFGGVCDPQKAALSPDGKWAAGDCYVGPYGKDSFLQVASLDGATEWRVYFRDYANGGGYDSKDLINFYRWSPDSQYVYATAWSRLSGCCWIGDRVLLVRLDLNTGAQIAFLNGMSENYPTPLNFAISEDGRYLFYSPQESSLDITNLSTGETQRVELQLPFSIDTNFVIMSPEGDQLILGLFRLPEDEYQYVLESLALINLTTGKQSIVISDMTTTGTLYPIKWEDGDHVLLSNYPARPGLADFWLFNIQTGELVQVENP